MRRKHIIGLGALLGVAISTPAFAESRQPYAVCDRDVSDRESEIAHQKYIAGKQDYDEGNFESAVRRFRDAYALDCTKHDLLILIASAYERKGDKDGAVFALETYVERAPTAPDVDSYRSKIEDLKQQIAAEPPTTEPAEPEPAAPEPLAEPRGHTVYPWVMVATGVVALGVGIAVIVTAPALPPLCNADTRTCDRLEGEQPIAFERRQIDAGKSVDQPLWGTVVAAGGGLLIAGGLVWHFLEPSAPPSSGKTKLRPAVAPDYAGLALGGTF